MGYSRYIIPTSTLVSGKNPSFSRFIPYHFPKLSRIHRGLFGANRGQPWPPGSRISSHQPTPLESPRTSESPPSDLEAEGLRGWGWWKILGKLRHVVLNGIWSCNFIWLLWLLWCLKEFLIHILESEWSVLDDLIRYALIPEAVFDWECLSIINVFFF